jgi:methylase of polypeptide subunit release factors
LATDNSVLCGIPPSTRHSSHQNTFQPYLANFLNPSFAEDPKLAPPYDILTSNPPYIPWDEYLELPPEVTEYEDPKALFGGPSGLDFYQAIARLIANKDFMRPGGLLALEVGHSQAKTVEKILHTSGRITQTEIWSDPWGKQRTVIARL